MEHFSSSPYSSGRLVHKRLIPIITIDDEDDDVNEEFSSPVVKRDKVETTTETFDDEASTPAGSLKEDEETEHSLHDLNGTDVSNITNLTNDTEVQRFKDLIHDILKQQSLADDETSGEHIDSQTVSVAGDNNYSNGVSKAQNFEFQTTATGNKRLIVFDSNDKTLCYKFYKGRAGYNCGKCWERHNKTVAAKLLKDENGEEYVLMVNPHLCKPFKYVPQSPNFQIQQHENINAPNYEIQRKRNGKRFLIIFVPTNPNLCFYYRNKVNDYFICCGCFNRYKKSTSAKLLKDMDGNEYVQANVPHLCEPVPYVANKWSTIQASDFFVPQLNKKLVVFNSDHRNFCYHYNYKKGIKGYNCVACLNVHRKCVSSKVIKDDNGNECLQANTKHLCDPYTYKVSGSFDMVKSPNFTLVNGESNGSAASMLRVYASIVRSTCYNFTQLGSSYACSGRLTKGREFIAKLFKDENDEDVVLVWKNQKHVCLPVICC